MMGYFIHTFSPPSHKRTRTRPMRNFSVRPQMGEVNFSLLEPNSLNRTNQPPLLAAIPPRRVAPSYHPPVTRKTATYLLSNAGAQTERNLLPATTPLLYTFIGARAVSGLGGSFAIDYGTLG